MAFSSHPFQIKKIAGAALLVFLASAGCTHALDGPRGGGTGGGGNISNGNSSSPPGITPAPGGNNGAPPVGELDPRFVPDMKQAFNEYRAWGRVDDEMRWAPFLCRMPMPGRPTMSAAAEGGHAKKLYSLFARDHNAYVSLENPNGMHEPTAPTGLAQIVAKESYIPELVDNPTPNQDPNDPPFGAGAAAEGGDHFHPYVKGEDGKTYRASKLAGVYFVIEKQGDLQGTDDGFIYGTVTSTGEVTSAGRVSSCMGCHVQAKHRRFFGKPGHI